MNKKQQTKTESNRFAVDKALSELHQAYYDLKAGDRLYLNDFLPELKALIDAYDRWLD